MASLPRFVKNAFSAIFTPSPTCTANEGRLGRSAQEQCPRLLPIGAPYAYLGFLVPLSPGAAEPLRECPLAERLAQLQLQPRSSKLPLTKQRDYILMDVKAMDLIRTDVRMKKEAESSGTCGVVNVR
jgi:hypothetical protein